MAILDRPWVEATKDQLARCPHCRGEVFTLTNGSAGQVHVNCAKPECSTYIGQIPPEHISHAPTVEPH